METQRRRHISPVSKKMELEGEEYLTTREAAEFLRISTDRLRHLKDRFPHIKTGGENQSKLLFLKSGILDFLGGAR